MRLKSLDVFRGITMTSMILVNNPGSWDFVYPPMRHAEWHGCTPTDLIFPFFLFIVGVAMAFSMAKYTEPMLDSDKKLPSPYPRIIQRGLILFGLGLLLNWFGKYDLSTIRIMGVLQRISIAYVLGSIAILNLKRQWLWIGSILLLLGYWGAMTLIPVPDYGVGNLTPEGNLGAYLDRTILGTQHLLKQGKFDPEGLFSTLPALVSLLIGYLTGHWIKSQPIQSRTSQGLVLFGVGLVVIGWGWGFAFPLNKPLWTSSYVLFTGGWALIGLAICYELIEVRKVEKWGWPFEVMGLNAILLFVGSGLVARILLFNKVGSDPKDINYYAWIYQNIFRSWLGDLNGSLGFAIATVLLWWLILYGLYRQKWFLKV